MNKKESILNNDINPIHRILKRYIKNDPNPRRWNYIWMRLFLGSWKMFLETSWVVSTSVGYAGGNKNNPTYYEVCTGLTGHSEVVRVVWDKSEIDISDLLKMFWECHDPTQKNRQGNDIGVNIGLLSFIKVKIIKKSF